MFVWPRFRRSIAVWREFLGASVIRRAYDDSVRRVDGGVDGNANVTGRSLLGGRMRSMQRRNATVSPAKARSMALRVKALASPSSRFSAAMAVLPRAPAGRPLGFPDFPFGNGFPAIFIYLGCISAVETAGIGQFSASQRQHGRSRAPTRPRTCRRG